MHQLFLLQTDLRPNCDFYPDLFHLYEKALLNTQQLILLILVHLYSYRIFSRQSRVVKRDKIYLKNVIFYALMSILRNKKCPDGSDFQPFRIYFKINNFLTFHNVLLALEQIYDYMIVKGIQFYLKLALFSFVLINSAELF